MSFQKSFILSLVQHWPSRNGEHSSGIQIIPEKKKKLIKHVFLYLNMSVDISIHVTYKHEFQKHETGLHFYS